MESLKIVYLNNHVDDFKFDLYLTEFDFKNKAFAEEDFITLINKIMQLKITDSSQNLIQLANKIVGEEYMVCIYIYIY